MNDLISGKKSNITLAINNETVSEIKKWAESKKISINALVSDILEKNRIFYRYAEDIGCVVLPPAIFAVMLGLMDENVLSDLLKKTSEEIMPSILTHNNIEFSKENLIKYCCDGIGLWSGLYKAFRYHYDSENNLCFVFEHTYGMKWSRILSEGYSYFIEKIFKQPTKSQIFPNTVVIKIKEYSLKR